jgi:hypothetical protein
MRAAIVEREHVPALMHHEDRAMAAVRNLPMKALVVPKAATDGRSSIDS